MGLPIDPADVLALAPMAGRGTRLGVAGSKEVVSLAATSGRAGPVLCEVMLQRMYEAGLRQALLILGDGKQDIRERLGERFRASDGGRLALRYAAANNSPNTPTSIDAGFALMRDRVCALGFADILYQPCAGYARALTLLATTQADIVLGLFPTSQPATSDMVAFDSEGRVSEVLVKQAAGARYAYTWSLAVWRPTFSEFMHQWLADGDGERGQRELFVGDAVIAAQAAGLVVSAVVVSPTASLDAGTPATLALARSRDWRMGKSAV